MTYPTMGHAHAYFMSNATRSFYISPCIQLTSHSFLTLAFIILDISWFSLAVSNIENIIVDFNALPPAFFF